MSITSKRVLKFFGWVVGIILGLILIFVVYVEVMWNAKNPRPAPNLKAPTDSVTLARGEYIYKFQAQCWSCHGDSAGDANALPHGGVLFDLTNIGPGFGKWYARNLTPDTVTGLGSWTDGEIVQALREGISKNRTTLFPIMPADWYHGMADEDALSVVAYLRSLPPVRNVVPRDEPSFMAKALFTFKLMKPKDQVTTPVVAPPQGITPEYGRYVSSNLADCADCHTPRNLQDGSFYLDSLFAGSSFAFEGTISSFARNITPDSGTGIGPWNEDQFINAVTTGMRPDGTVLTPHMPYAYYKSWSVDDLRAVFAFLRGVPPRKRTVPPSELSQGLLGAQGVEQGKLLFNFRCQICHGRNGNGAQPTKVRLADVFPSMTDDELTGFIAAGQTNVKMPAFGKTLSSRALMNIVDFMKTWKKN